MMIRSAGLTKILAGASAFTMLALAVALVSATARSEPAAPKKSEAAESAPAEPEGAVVLDDDGPADQYCAHVKDLAENSRLQVRKKEVEETQKELEQRIQQMEKMTAQLKTWLQKREDFAKLATDSLVEIYTRMDADAAATRLVAMPEKVAAAIISRLSPKVAGSILGVMETSKAARLTSLLAGVAEMSNASNPAPSPQTAVR